jgi:hypothetical protein
MGVHAMKRRDDLFDLQIATMEYMRDEIARRQPSRVQTADVWREIADEIIDEYRGLAREDDDE